MRNWVLEKYGEEDVDEHKTFAKHSKFAWKEFFDEVENISDKAKEAIIVQAEKDMRAFIDALKMKDTAVISYNYIIENNLSEAY